MINTIVIISIIAILYIGLKTKSKPNSNSYLFAGRKLTLFPFVATLVSTWYGGILEIGRFSYENGIVTWLIFGFSYYIAAYIFSSFIAPKIITKNIQTIPVLIEKAYGKVAAIISIVLILFISSPAPYLKILSSIFQFLWPINEEVSQSYLASFFGLMTLGRVIFVFLRVKLTNQILLMLSLSLSLLFIILGATTDPIFLSLVGLTMSIYFPCALDFISESFPKRINQALPFVLNIVAIKLLIAHFLVGVITDYFGDFSIVYVIGVCISLAFLSIFFCRSSRHQSELQP